MDYRRVNKNVFGILLISFFYFAKANRITNFNLYNVNGNVEVRFTISKGAPCNGYKIWHSVDSLNFIQVFEDPGICGSNTEDITKSFLHSGPSSNLTHYYKVELIGTEISIASSLISLIISNKTNLFRKCNFTKTTNLSKPAYKH